LLESAKKLNPVLLDCGCGVGNAFFPLFEHIPNLTVNAFDFSSVAVELIKVTFHVKGRKMRSMMKRRWMYVCVI
jgi:ubiquinone/menaquinone biosynthesis C-methylase UbiE